MVKAQHQNIRKIRATEVQLLTLLHGSDHIITYHRKADIQASGVRVNITV